MFTIGLYLNIILLFVAIAYILAHYILHRKKKSNGQDEEQSREHRMYNRYAKDVDFEQNVLCRPNYVITSTDMLRSVEPLPIYENK